MVRKRTDRDGDASLDEVRNALHDALKFGGTGNDLDRVLVVMGQLVLGLRCLALETIDVLEISISVLGRGLQDLQLVGSNTGLVDEGAFDVSSKHRGAGLG